jgi:hypothetical protein
VCRLPWRPRPPSGLVGWRDGVLIGSTEPRYLADNFQRIGVAWRSASCPDWSRKSKSLFGAQPLAANLDTRENRRFPDGFGGARRGQNPASGPGFPRRRGCTILFLVSDLRLNQLRLETGVPLCCGVVVVSLLFLSGAQSRQVQAIGDVRRTNPFHHHAPQFTYRWLPTVRRLRNAAAEEESLAHGGFAPWVGLFAVDRTDCAGRRADACPAFGHWRWQR